MKKLNLALMIGLSALLFQACNSAEKDSTDLADSMNMQKDTSMTGAGIAVVEDDAKFVVDAANAGMTEVDLAKLTMLKATNAKVKEFAGMIVTDHSKANEELMALAKAKNITLPEAVNSESKETMNTLSEKEGPDFDKAYVSAMVDDHKKDVAMFETASEKVKDPDVKAFVDKTLPVLKAHLEKITTIEEGMK